MLVSRCSAFIDSVNASKMVEEMSMITRMTVLPDGIVGTAGREIIEFINVQKLVVYVTGSNGSTRKNRVPNAPSVEHRSISVVRSYDIGHKVNFT